MAGSPAMAEASFLVALRSYEDPRSGIRERFLTPTLGDGRTVAVLSGPLAGEPRRGWVICHSYGLEQLNLQPLEVPLARQLAASGHSVLRYHSQGYGDSELPPEHISLRSHVDDALDAVRLLAASTSVSSVGLIGARFGGTVAAMAAEALASEEIAASALVLWEPVVDGRRYMRSLLRLGLLTELVSKGRATESAREPEDMLREAGILDVQGFPLRLEVFEEVSAVDLAKAVFSFRGDSLVVQISKTSGERPDLQRLVSRFAEIGGTSTCEVLLDRKADKFGQPRFVGRGDGTKGDTQATLSEILVSSTLSWCAALPDGDAPP
ncbi:MAG: serine aminopeptidase domain-containing protein [Actinomycetota bacterium]